MTRQKTTATLYILKVKERLGDRLDDVRRNGCDKLHVALALDATRAEYGLLQCGMSDFELLQKEYLAALDEMRAIMKTSAR